MQDTAKYLVHADVTADGVVERSDVVGAVFGQTEGLLGDELDLRSLQDSSKVGRIDVEIDSQNGQSYGHVTIATSLDQVETAILGAALETIDRVGPCRSTVEVRKIEDVRAAKRREVVERAKELFAEAFDESVRSSRDLVDEVREAVRVEDIVEYEGLPAGPRVAESDAIVVVEGRADVLTLLRYGIKNAVAVEGTSVPEAVAALTEHRTVTAFLDGDRGGELILKELAQVGDVDYVAFAPEGRSVEDLSRHEAMAALREKVPYHRVAEADDIGDVAPRVASRPDGVGAGDATDAGPAVSPESDERRREADGAASPGASADSSSADRPGQLTPNDPGQPAPNDPGQPAPDDPADPTIDDPDGPAEEDAPPTAGHASRSSTGPVDGPESIDGDDAVGVADGAEGADGADGAEVTDASDGSEPADTTQPADGTHDEPGTLRGHVRQVVGEATGTVRLLDASFGVVASGDVGEALDLVANVDADVAAVVLDGAVDQRLLDVAAQRGVGQVVAAETGEFVKKPTSVRVRTADQLLATNEA